MSETVQHLKKKKDMFLIILIRIKFQNPPYIILK